MQYPFSFKNRFKPVDIILMSVILVFSVAGVLLIAVSRSSRSADTSGLSVPIISEIDGRAVEPIDNSSDVDADNPQAVKDELIVVIRNKADTSQFGNTIKPIEGIPDTYKLNVAGSQSLARKQAEIEKKNGVESAEPNEIIYGLDASDSSKPTVRIDQWQWGLDRVKARDAWAVTQGEGVVVAVVDSGSRGEHISLSGRIVKPKAFPPKDSKGASTNGSVACTNTGSALGDVHGHGTSAASVIASSSSEIYPSGVAPLAKVMPVQVLGCDNFGTTEWIVQGIRYAADNGANIINLSLGSDSENCPKVQVDAIKYALSKNITVVASSGNGTKGRIVCPARIDGVIAVGASDKNNKLISNSEWGSNWGSEQSVVAPGEDIAAACSCLNMDGRPDNRFRFKFNGTSASAPFVSGVAALVKSVNPGLSPAQVKDIIQKSATNPGSYAGKLPNDKYGHGVVNALEAVNRAR